MTSRRTLVTGASGFLGSALVRQLADAREPLCLLAREGREGRARALAGEVAAHAISIDVRTVKWDEPGTVARALEGIEIGAAYHLAGGRTLGAGPEVEAANREANLKPLAALLDALAAHPPAAFVLVSSGEVYGDQPPPCGEQLTPRPLTAYGVAKVAAEEAALAAFRQRGLPVSVARPSVVYGPGQPPVMFIPQLIEALVVGESFAMTAGDQIRDVVFVDDVAAALRSLAECPEAAGGIYNVGSGGGVRLADLAHQIQALLPAGGLRLGAVPYRDREVMDYRLSIDRITAMTRWRPATALADGLRRTVDSAVRAHSSVPRHG